MAGEEVGIRFLFSFLVPVTSSPDTVSCGLELGDPLALSGSQWTLRIPAGKVCGILAGFGHWPGAGVYTRPQGPQQTTAGA